MSGCLLLIHKCTRQKREKNEVQIESTNTVTSAGQNMYLARAKRHRVSYRMPSQKVRQNQIFDGFVKVLSFFLMLSSSYDTIEHINMRYVIQATCLIVVNRNGQHDTSGCC